LSVFDPEPESRGARRRQYGTCHRCGWKGSVVKVKRSDRKRLNSGRAFGRLCDECVDDLLNSQVAGMKAGKLRFGRNRHVA